MNDSVLQYAYLPNNLITMIVDTLHTLDWIILVAYFVILLAIGLWASHKTSHGQNKFLASRSLRWHHIGFSMWGTNVGPSMLIASASAGFTTGIVSGNYAWYAFIFIGLLAFVFAPRYIGEKISTLPEFMGKRFGQSTRSILAWYTIVTVLISWLALTLFAGGVLIRQLFGIPMWMSAMILLAISAFFTIMGGLKAVAYTNVYQMVLLIIVSAVLTVVGIITLGDGSFCGGIAKLADKDIVPENYWHLFRSKDDLPAYYWLPILLGYPISGLWFWCTDQSMVQPVLAARDLNEGQKGTNLTGWLKILDVAIYIVPGIVCFALVRTGFFGSATIDPDNAYMALVTQLFPIGMVGLVMAVLTAALVSTIGSSLNALSTVFSMDIYVKNINPKATPREISRIGHIVTIVGAMISILITIAVDNIKGMDLFNVFQSVLSFIAPPMAAVFVMGVFWKRCTTRAANMVLSLGTALSILTGISYLWIIPGASEAMHFMMLSFILFCILVAGMVIVSLLDTTEEERQPMRVAEGRTSRGVIISWIVLAIVMVGLYIFFN